MIYSFSLHVSNVKEKQNLLLFEFEENGVGFAG